MGNENLSTLKSHKNVRLYVVLFILILAVIIGVFFFFYHMYQKDVKALSDFSASYEKFDKAISDFSKSVFAEDQEVAEVLKHFDRVYSEVYYSLYNALPDSDRLALAEEAIYLNDQLIDYLNNTDDLEHNAESALLELDAQAAARLSSLIKNDEKLMDRTLEISETSIIELNDLKAYKSTLIDKREITSNLLQNIVDDDGAINGYNKFLEYNEAVIQSQNADLEILERQFGHLTYNRKNIYASYQKLAAE